MSIYARNVTNRYKPPKVGFGVINPKTAESREIAPKSLYGVKSSETRFSMKSGQILEIGAMTQISRFGAVFSLGGVHFSLGGVWKSWGGSGNLGGGPGGSVLGGVPGPSNLARIVRTSPPFGGVQKTPIPLI